METVNYLIERLIKVCYISFFQTIFFNVIAIHT